MILTAKIEKKDVHKEFGYIKMNLSVTYIYLSREGSEIQASLRGDNVIFSIIYILSEPVYNFFYAHERPFMYPYN